MYGRARTFRLPIRSWARPRSQGVVGGRTSATLGEGTLPEPGCCFFRLRRRGAATAEIGVWGDLDWGSAHELEQLLDGVKQDQSRIVIDLSECRFADATALSVLVRAHRAGHDRGPVLILRAPQAPVRRVLEFCGLDRVLTIYDGGPGSVGRSGPTNAA